MSTQLAGEITLCYQITSPGEYFRDETLQVFQICDTGSYKFKTPSSNENHLKIYCCMLASPHQLSYAKGSSYCLTLIHRKICKLCVGWKYQVAKVWEHKHSTACNTATHYCTKMNQKTEKKTKLWSCNKIFYIEINRINISAVNR